ncbi:MAG: hypothetical protein ACUVTL_07080 [Thermoproteota archaeon]
MSRNKVLAGVVWVFMLVLWFFSLLIASGPWSLYSAIVLSALIILSIVCLVALWKLIKDRQTVLLATSIAGMASFLAAYFVTMLPAVLP